jgi:8-oxo-dGTP pyrophosphatase MutT (NUDIX family)
MKEFINIMRKLNENKNGRVITFDFDNTIVKSFENDNDGVEIQYQFGGINKEIIKRIKKFKDSGATVFVVTSRNVDLEVPESSVDTMLKKLNIDVDGIFYTNGEPKAQKLFELGSSLHYDDDPKEHEAVKAYGNLHKNFDISIKFPDDLLSDIDEVAKGILITEDGKFVIVQRSDSLEWDAAGGHLMEGEEPSYAFYREVKEEMRIEVKKVTFLKSMDTTWKKKNKLVHYFVATAPYTTQELYGAIELQWELEDYFVGNIEEIEKQMETPEGATENLRNVLNLISNDDFLLSEMDDYQSKALRGHSKMKKRVVGLDGRDKKRRNTGAKGLKWVKDHSKAKSAPPGAPGGGWGPSLEEEKSQKRKKIKIRIKGSNSGGD